MAKRMNRKGFMDLAVGIGGVGVAFVTAFPLLKFMNPPKNTAESGDWIDAGTLEEIQAAGSVDILAPTGIPLILVPEGDDGVIALEKKCPHLGCMVVLEEGELLCPCHGAKFTMTGEVIAGPAPRGLKQFQVEIRPNGHVFVGKEVG